VEELSVIEIAQGVGSLIFVIFTTIVGLIIISKYFEHKIKTFLGVGIAWIGMAFPWLGDAINIILYFSKLPYLSDFAYLFIVNAFIPLFVILWLSSLLTLMNYEKKNIIIIITIILTIIFEIAFLFLIFNDVKNIGTRKGPFYYEFSVFIDIYMIIVIIIVLYTGLTFAIISTKSQNEEVKLKGKILLIAFILFAIGAVLDSQIHNMEATMVLSIRILLALSSFIFYIGFILPEWARKILLKLE